MITANISFFTSTATVDLAQSPALVRKNLNDIGVLTPTANIMLDNARTLKVELYAEDNTGENILSILDRNTDTLGTLNRLCNNIQTLDYRDDKVFTEKLADGEFSSLTDALRMTEKLKEQRRIKNKREQSR